MGALSTAFAGALLLIARESPSAPKSSAPTDAAVPRCLVEVKGAFTERGPCTIEYVTDVPFVDAGISAELTSVRIVSGVPAALVVVSFFNEPRVGSQAVALDAGAGRMSYASAHVERNGQHWEALSHVESDFAVTVSSVKATCNDGGLKCWEIHGRVRANVPSALLSPFAVPLALSVIF